MASSKAKETGEGAQQQAGYAAGSRDAGSGAGQQVKCSLNHAFTTR